MRLKKHHNFLFLTAVWFCSLNALFGQSGGRNAFDFMNLPSNARLGSMGGYNVSLQEKDINLLFSNPALISEKWDNHVAFNYLSYYADVSLSSVVYAKKLQKHGMWTVGLQYLSLGEMEKKDDTGLDLGTFNAGEYAFVLGHSHQIGNIQLGTSLKYANSTIDIYTAHAVLFDIGGVFIHPEQDFTIGLAIKNVGFLISDYTENGDQSLPFDIQIGTSIKPEHMPFRFSITVHHLIKPNLLYDPKEEDIENNNIDRPGVVDKVLSHFVIGSEILISKNFNIRLGYNHLINQELGLTGGSKGSGFSFGFMTRVKAFEFSFGRATYHATGGRNFFSLQSNLNRLLIKDNN